MDTKPKLPPVKLGKFELCFDVPNLAVAVEFYEKLGFSHVKGALEYGTITLSNGDIQFTLFIENYIQNEFGVSHLFNFRGGDVENNHKLLDSRGIPFEMKPRTWDNGGVDAKFRDPSGNLIYLDSMPEERKQYKEELEKLNRKLL